MTGLPQYNPLSINELLLRHHILSIVSSRLNIIEILQQFKYLRMSIAKVFFKVGVKGFTSFRR